MSILDFRADTEPEGEPAPIDPRDVDWNRDAAWHMREIRDLETKEQRTREAFDREIERLTEQRDMAVSAIRNRIAWHTTPLVQLHRALLAEDPKNNKTIVLPYGKLVSSTPQKPKVRFMDRVAFIEWARTNAPDLVQAKWNEDRRAVAAALGDTLVPVGEPKVGWSVDVVGGSGEIVPGITYALDDTTFGIQMADEL